MPEFALGPPFNDIPVPEPLSVRAVGYLAEGLLSLSVIGPLGAVELRIRRALLDQPGAGMSMEYHFRQPSPGADDMHTDCLVLGGDCYPDGEGGSPQDVFLPMFRAGQSEAIVDTLVRWYCTTFDVPVTVELAIAAGETLVLGAVNPEWD